MKLMYLNCDMGIAGDMFTAALLDSMSEAEKRDFEAEFNKLEIPGVRMSIEASEKCGVLGTHVRIKVNGIEESEDMHNDYS